jgi:DNA invertase Pin-like site-specific DNA recombinase
MTGKRIGYKRVSTAEQNPDRQLEGIPLDKVFIDYASAASLDRIKLQIMIEYAREDDIIIVHSMDRLARTVSDLKKIVDDFVSRKINVQFIKENLIFNGENSSLSNLILHIMGAFAEFEHAFIRERQAEGIEIAKKKGKFLGRKRKITDEQLEIIKQQLRTKKKRIDIAKDFSISAFTLYNYINKMDEKDDYIRNAN